MRDRPTDDDHDTREAEAHRGDRMLRVYVCHPYGDDPAGNRDKVTAICRALAEAGYAPVAPQLYLHLFIAEDGEREKALAIGLALVAGCDALFVCGPYTSSGMQAEIEEAHRLGVPVALTILELTALRAAELPHA